MQLPRVTHEKPYECFRDAVSFTKAHAGFRETVLTIHES